MKISSAACSYFSSVTWFYYRVIVLLLFRIKHVGYWPSLRIVWHFRIHA